MTSRGATTSVCGSPHGARSYGDDDDGDGVDDGAQVMTAMTAAPPRVEFIEADAPYVCSPSNLSGTLDPIPACDSDLDLRSDRSGAHTSAAVQRQPSVAGSPRGHPKSATFNNPKGDDRTASLSETAVNLLRNFRVPFFVLAIAFALLVSGCVIALVTILDPMIQDQARTNVHTAVRGALVAVAERTVRPFRLIHSTVAMHARDTEASGDTCSDGRTTAAASRRISTKYAASLDRPVFPVWSAYQMIRVPRPSGETWTFCGCTTTGGHGYPHQHCDVFNQTHLNVVDLRMPGMEMDVRLALPNYNRTGASYMPAVYRLREHIDSAGVWTSPAPYVYPSGRIVVTLAVHIPVRFQYNWEFDADEAPPPRNSSAFHVYRTRDAPRPGLNASDPALRVAGAPFARKVSQTESLDVFLEGIREFLIATAPDRSQVALVHVLSGLLIASTSRIPLFDQSGDKPRIWPARATPHAQFNRVVTEVLDHRLAASIRTAVTAAEHGHLPEECHGSNDGCDFLEHPAGIPTPVVFMMDDLIVTATLITPRPGLLLCIIAGTDKAHHYAHADRARVVAASVAAFAGGVCVVVFAVILLLIQRSLFSLRKATVAAARLQLTPAELKAQGRSIVLEMAELQDAFAGMNAMLREAGAYLPHGVRTEWLLQYHGNRGNDAYDVSGITNPTSEAVGGEMTGGRIESSHHPPQQGHVYRAPTPPPVDAQAAQAFSKRQRHVAVLQINVVGFHTLTAAADQRRRTKEKRRRRCVDGAIPLGKFLTPLAPSPDCEVIAHRQARTLFSAADAFAFIDGLTAIVIGAAAQHGGVLDAFHGDRFTVSFNAVTAVRHPEVRAFCCAAALRTATEATVVAPDSTQSDEGRQCNTTDRLALPLTMGVAAGIACVGSIGNATVRQLGILGPAIRQASLLERLCRTYRGITKSMNASLTPGAAQALSGGEEQEALSPSNGRSAPMPPTVLQPPPASASPSGQIGSDLVLLTGVEKPRSDVDPLVSVSAVATAVNESTEVKPSAPNANLRQRRDSVGGTSKRTSCSVVVSDSTHSSGDDKAEGLGDGSLTEFSAVAPSIRPTVPAAPSRPLRSAHATSTALSHRSSVLEPQESIWCVVSETVAAALYSAGVDTAPVDRLLLSGDSTPSFVFAVVGATLLPPSLPSPGPTIHNPDSAEVKERVSESQEGALSRTASRTASRTTSRTSSPPPSSPWLSVFGATVWDSPRSFEDGWPLAVPNPSDPLPLGLLCQVPQSRLPRPEFDVEDLFRSESEAAWSAGQHATEEPSLPSTLYYVAAAVRGANVAAIASQIGGTGDARPLGDMWT